MSTSTNNPNAVGKINSIVRLAMDLQAEIDSTNSFVGVTPDHNLWHGESDFFPLEQDVACNCGCGQTTVSNFLYNKLVQARLLSGVPFVILSWNRCPTYNTSEGGSDTSSHLKGLAVDIGAGDSERRFKILKALILVGFNRIGIYSWGIHVDVDPDKPAEVIWHD